MKPTPRKLKLSLSDLQVSSFTIPTEPGALARGTVKGMTGPEDPCVPPPVIIDWTGFPDSELCPKTLDPTPCCGPTIMTGACCWQ